MCLADQATPAPQMPMSLSPWPLALEFWRIRASLQRVRYTPCISLGSHTLTSCGSSGASTAPGISVFNLASAGIESCVCKRAAPSPGL